MHTHALWALNALGLVCVYPLRICTTKDHWLPITYYYMYMSMTHAVIYNMQGKSYMLCLIPRKPAVSSGQMMFKGLVNMTTSKSTTRMFPMRMGMRWSSLMSLTRAR